MIRFPTTNYLVWGILLFLIVLSSLPNKASAQGSTKPSYQATQRKDSLTRVASDARKPQRAERIRALTKLAPECPSKEIVAADSLARLAIKLSEELPSPYWLFTSLGTLGYQQVKHSPSEALNIALRRLGIAKAYGNARMLSSANYFLGMVYHEANNRKKALGQYLLAESIAQQSGDSSFLANILNSHANLLSEDLRDKEAEKIYIRVAKVYTELNDQKNLAGVTSNLGATRYRLGQPSVARDYWLKALKMMQESKTDSVKLYASLYSLSAYYAYGKEKKLDSAEYYGEAAFDAVTATKNYEKLREILRHLTDVYEAQGDPVSALDCQKQAMDAEMAYQEAANQEAYNRNLVRFQTQRQTLKAAEEKRRARLRTRERNIAIAGGVAIVALIGLLFNNYRRQTALEAKARKATEALAEKRLQEAINTLQVRTLEAFVEGQEEERGRLAKELHDQINTTLGILSVNFSALETRITPLLPNPGAETTQQFARLKGMINDASNDVRRISHSIAEGVIFDFGLVAALQQLCNTFNGGDKVQAELLVHGFGKEQDLRLPSTMELCLLRIVQESLHNILKHANATEVTIDLTYLEGHDAHTHQDSISLMVIDNGKGFATLSNPSNAQSVDSLGIGMRSMLERVERLGGTLKVDSSPGHGTTIVVEMPFQPGIA